MNLYIFITTPITIPGGSQCYVAAKAKYLESIGWKVVVFSPNTNKSVTHCPIKYLDKYLKENIIELSLPPFKFPSTFVSHVLRKMSRIIGDISIYENKIIESHEDIYSQWGELLANRVKARHYFFLLNEFYRGVNSYYEEKMDFYNFKFDRKEIEGTKETFKRLFEGHREISSNDLGRELTLDECPILDYENEQVDNIIRFDWNICYIGRGNKSYVPNILNDVGKFAGLYLNKEIQLILVSDIDFHRHILDGLSETYKNLHICELGLLHPIPSSLYNKIDVVIAGSGSARHSCEEGAIVIVADTETKMSNGILGYETQNSVYRAEDSICTDFVDALKRVLIEKVQKKLPYRFPPRLGVEQQTKQHFELFSMSTKMLEYYDEDKLLDGKKDYMAILKLYAYYHFPVICKALRRIVMNK